jgi:hypothetical protein
MIALEVREAVQHGLLVRIGLYYAIEYTGCTRLR